MSKDKQKGFSLSKPAFTPAGASAPKLTLPASLGAGSTVKPKFDLEAAQHNLRKAFTPSKG